MKNSLFYFIILLLPIIGCEESISTSKEKSKELTSSKNENKPNQFSEPIIKLDSNYVPGDMVSELILLEPGVFHNNEIDSIMQATNYFAVVNKKASKDIFMQYSIPRFELVEDPLVDNVGEKTGINVLPKLKDSVMYYISDHPAFKESQVNIIIDEKGYRSYFPGDSFHFEYAGIEYVIFAEGIMPESFKKGDYADPKNYKLYLADPSDTTLLFAFPSSFDYFGGVELIADFDHDNKPDIIINTSAHYNSSDVTLYLSSFAPKGKIVTPVAQLRSVGC